MDYPVGSVLPLVTDRSHILLLPWGPASRTVLNFCYHVPSIFSTWKVTCHHACVLFAHFYMLQFVFL